MPNKAFPVAKRCEVSGTCGETATDKLASDLGEYIVPTCIPTRETNLQSAIVHVFSCWRSLPNGSSSANIAVECVDCFKLFGNGRW